MTEHERFGTRRGEVRASPGEAPPSTMRPGNRTTIRDADELIELYTKWVAGGTSHIVALDAVLRMAFADGVGTDPRRFRASVEVYGTVGDDRVKLYDATVNAPHSNEFRVAGQGIVCVLRAEIDQ